MARQALIILFTVLAFGILVPWYKGFTFLDARIIAAYGFIAILFVAPAAADSFGSEGSEFSRRAALSRVVVLVLFAWGVSAVVLLTSFVTLNVAYWQGTFHGPPVELVTAVLVSSLAGCLAVAVGSAVLARTFSAGVVKAIMRILFLLVLLVLVFNSRLPDAWQIAMAEHSTRRAITGLAWETAGVCLAAAVVLLFPLLKKSARS